MQEWTIQQSRMATMVTWPAAGGPCGGACMKLGPGCSEGQTIGSWRQCAAQAQAQAQNSDSVSPRPRARGRAPARRVVDEARHGRAMRGDACRRWYQEPARIVV